MAGTSSSAYRPIEAPWGDRHLVTVPLVDWGDRHAVGGSRWGSLHGGRGGRGAEEHNVATPAARQLDPVTARAVVVLRCAGVPEYSSKGGAWS